jgi:hypothetical protein
MQMGWEIANEEMVLMSAAAVDPSTMPTFLLLLLDAVLLRWRICSFRMTMEQ